jgi:hypothetical protein
VRSAGHAESFNEHKNKIRTTLPIIGRRRKRRFYRHSAFADGDDNLWVVDDSAPFHTAYIEGGPKLVKIDLKTDTAARIYPIGPELAPPGAVLGHVRIDQRFAYLTESKAGVIIVIELDTGKAQRRLAGHPKTRCDPSVVPVIEGKEFRLANGKVQQVSGNLLELNADGKYLYFMALFGARPMRLETRLPQDPPLSDDQFGDRIEEVVNLPPYAGIAAITLALVVISFPPRRSISFLSTCRVEACHARPSRARKALTAARVASGFSICSMWLVPATGV